MAPEGGFAIGTAGWTIPRQNAAEMEGVGSHLQRYALRFNAAEINSSFHRAHKPETYARWAASVPAGFRFAVKIPREITHTRKLVSVTRPFAAFLREAQGLGDRLGPLLVQLPPSLAYAPLQAQRFFEMLRARFEGDVVCEPRHASWFDAPADKALTRFAVARVAADPARDPRAAVPGGWPGLIYYRLHGAPRMYYSAYDASYLKRLARNMRKAAAPHGQWCIFDNTAGGEALGNALALQRLLRGK